MVDTIVALPNQRPGVSWGAIIAGAFAAAAISLVLLLLGSGIGLASLSPWETGGMTAAGFGIGAAIWLVVVHGAASALGGYIAGRLRVKWVGIRSHEMFFRDTAHGFLAWAVATVFTFAVMTTTISSLLSGTTQATATVLSGIGQGAASSAAEAIDDVDPTAYLVDKLFRSDRVSPGGNRAVARDEAGRILMNAAVEGELSADDKERLATLVAARTDLTPTEAEARIDEIMADVQAAETEAKEAADTARQAAATLSLITVVALLVGAFFACLTAAWGGRQRDRNEIGEDAVT